MTSTPDTPPKPSQVRRTGYEYGIPLSAQSDSMQVAATSQRQQVLTELHQLYMTCDWISSPIDVISRTVTAGGLRIVEQTDVPEGQIPPEPPNVQRLRRLMRFCNPREDLVQLLRNVATDLQLFGDAYIEVVWLLGEPIALYGLDAVSMTVLADQHGEVRGYRQDVDGVRSANFRPHEVIHISLDAPRGGLYGVGPAQKALFPATAWLFTMSTLKECFRRGDPPRIHVDLAHFSDTDVQRWREQYSVANLGPKSVGTPVITTGGGGVQVLDHRKVTDYLDAARQLRDEIISCFGVPPAKLGIIETGNIGGGSGEAQDKTFRVNTVIPIANLILEKLNYHLVQEGFGIEDWLLEFGEIDFRDSKIIEEIREKRLHNGAYSLNRWRDEIGEPPVEGGDDPVLVQRQFVVRWDEMADMSKAMIAQAMAPAAKAGMYGIPPDMKADPTDVAPPDQLGMRDPRDAAGLPSPGNDGSPPEIQPEKESSVVRDQRRLSESWQRTYRQRRARALVDLPEWQPQQREREKVGV